MNSRESWRERLRRAVQSRPVLANIATLTSGTVIAQVIAMGLSIPLARIYTDTDYGQLRLFQSVVAIGVTIAALRYDMAIMLPKRDSAARVLVRLSSISIIVVSLLMSLACIVGSGWVARQYQSQTLADWMMAAGIVVFLMAEITTLQYWLNRHSRYKAIALNRIMQTVGVAAFQLVASLAFIGVSGLVVGMIIGQLLALIVLWVRSPDLRQPMPADAPTTRQVAWRYRKMPLLNGPNAVVDSIRTNGINFLLANMSVGGLGQYDRAMQMVWVPVSLIQGAVGQVFFQKMATVKRGQLRPLVVYTMTRMALVGLPVFAAVYLLAPWAFTFFFGPQWAEAGDFARALVPWMFMMMLSSPISTIFVVTETQQWLLLFATAYCVVPLTWLSLTHLDLHQTVWVLSLVMGGMLIIMIGMALVVATRYDQQDEVEEDADA